jgi:3-oxoacyl-[acyl-carrier protein] reductase
MAVRFAEEGADLFISARTEAPLRDAVAEITRLGGKAVPHVADVSDQKSAREMVQHALKEFGRIDILVNNAGIHKVSRFVDYSPEDFDQIMKVNI